MVTVTPDSDTTGTAVSAESSRPEAPASFFTLLRTRAEWRMAVAMAILAAAIYQVFVSAALDAFIADRATGTLMPIIAGFITGILVMACAAVAAAYHPSGTWRWGLTVALLPSIVVVLRIMYETIFISAHLHKLFPLEAVMVCVLTVPSAFIGASIGSMIGKSRKGQQA